MSRALLHKGWTLLLAVPLSCTALTPVTVAAELPATTTLHKGVDVSVHSGEVAWDQLVQAGHSFAFVKATEGVDLKDAAFEHNWAAMKAAGILRGAYHFYVTEDDPQEQARFFIDNVPLEAGDLVPVVDVELIGHGTQPGLQQRLQVWLNLVEQHYGVKPMIYTSAKFWNQHFDRSFGHYPLWIAEYDVESPTVPNGWQHWHLWQWKGDAKVAGVAKEADLSRVNAAQVKLEHLQLRENLQ